MIKLEVVNRESQAGQGASNISYLRVRSIASVDCFDEETEEGCAPTHQASVNAKANAKANANDSSDDENAEALPQGHDHNHDHNHGHGQVVGVGGGIGDDASEQGADVSEDEDDKHFSKPSHRNDGEEVLWAQRAETFVDAMEDLVQ